MTHQAFAIGDIVFTPDGYGRVSDVDGDAITVWIFGEHVGLFRASELRREIDPTPARYGMNIIARQAVLLRDQQKQLDLMRRGIGVYQARIEVLEALVKDLATENVKRTIEGGE